MNFAANRAIFDDNLYWRTVLEIFSCQTGAEFSERPNRSTGLSADCSESSRILHVWQPVPSEGEHSQGQVIMMLLDVYVSVFPDSTSRSTFDYGVLGRSSRVAFSTGDRSARIQRRVILQ